MCAGKRVKAEWHNPANRATFVTLTAEIELVVARLRREAGPHNEALDQCIHRMRKALESIRLADERQRIHEGGKA
jgi:hypothetical protein